MTHDRGVAAVANGSERLGNDGDIPPLVKSLCDAVTTHARAANRQWVVLVATLIVVLPQVIQLPSATNGHTAITKLPWELGEVPVQYFVLVSILVLSVLSVAFCNAYARMLRTWNMLLRVVDSYDAATVRGFDLRDLIEGLTQSGFLSVRSIFYLFQGEQRFRHDQPPRKWIRLLSALLAVILRIPGLVVFFVAPAAGLVVVTNAYKPQGPGALPWLVPPWMLWLFVIVPLVMFAITLTGEVSYIQRAAKRFLNWYGRVSQTRSDASLPNATADLAATTHPTGREGSASA